MHASSVTQFDPQKRGYVHSSINNSRRPIPKNGPIRLDRRHRLVDDVFEDGVGGVELRYSGDELYHIPFVSPRKLKANRMEQGIKLKNRKLNLI